MSQAAKNDFSEKLMVSSTGQLVASQKIPMIARPFVSERARKTLDIVRLAPFSTNISTDDSRSRNSSRKNVSRQMPFSTNSSVKAPSSDSAHTHLSWMN